MLMHVACMLLKHDQCACPSPFQKVHWVAIHSEDLATLGLSVALILPSECATMHFRVMACAGP